MKIKVIISFLAIVLVAGLSTALPIIKRIRLYETEHVRSTVGQTDNWLLYETRQFEFKYPQSFTVREDPSGYVTVREISESRERSSLSIGPLWERDADDSLESFVHGSQDYNDLRGAIYVHDSTSTINGASVFRFQVMHGSDSDIHYFYLRDDRHGVDFSFLEGAPAAETYITILSTFRFLPRN